MRGLTRFVFHQNVRVPEGIATLRLSRRPHTSLVPRPHASLVPRPLVLLLLAVSKNGSSVLVILHSEKKSCEVEPGN